MELCPCGSGKKLTLCCNVFIQGQQNPTTPEELMRSRYTAYTQNNMLYIQQTMQGQASLNFNAKEAEEQAKNIKWLGLQIMHSSSTHSHGVVEFIAYYLQNGCKQILHEVSQFDLIDGKWFYTNGQIGNQKKIGRNELCYCKSGKKYKKCCEKNS